MIAVVGDTSTVTALTRIDAAACYNPAMNSGLERVQQHLRLYEHPLVEFSARQKGDNIEVAITPRFTEPQVHTYLFEVHPRDLDDAQFEWMLQRHIFDGLQDYMIEMFVRTPQHSRQNQQREREGKP
jgi:hypothetical protein